MKHGLCGKRGQWCSGFIWQRLCEQVEGGDSSLLSTREAVEPVVQERARATGGSPVKCH